ncbi:VOC family protein [Acetobacterium bakii]|uniref:Glyoxalase n=1 Tax=Acetobacterium bakii TaxID=52689 RepID=A0A0L6TVX1_9FIRM|nr:VOC family protein [Acetobacterium bakii]KNZ40406.1 glyoxalase [Acetobacterium bakii]
MKIEPYINFSGNCREAVAYYAEVFGTEKAKIMTYGEMPPDPNYPMTDEVKDLVANTELVIKDNVIMFSDTAPGMPFTQGNNITILIISDDMDEIKTIYNKLKEGGSVEMELQETFWTKAYGSFTDKFGIGWQVSHDSGDMNS